MIKNKSEARENIEAAMRKKKRGDMITLEELKTISGLDTGGKRHSESAAYAVALRAAKFIETETNGHVYFRWDREKVAWRALLQEEIPSDSERRLKAIRKKAKRNARAAQAALQDGVSPQSEQRLIVSMTLSNAIATFASRSVAKQTMKMIPGVSSMSEAEAVDALRTRGN